MDLAEMLIARRGELGHTQEDAAPLVGVRLRAYQGWESRAHCPRSVHWRKLAAYLDTTPSAVGEAIGRTMERP